MFLICPTYHAILPVPWRDPNLGHGAPHRRRGHQISREHGAYNGPNPTFGEAELCRLGIGRVGIYCAFGNLHPQTDSS